MQIYLFIVVSFGIYAILSYLFKSEKLSKIVFISLASIHLFIVQGLRAVNVGEDLGRYSGYYYFMKDTSLEYVFNSRFEPGYQFLTRTFVNMGFSFREFIMVVSAFTIIAFAILVYKYSSNVFISYMFYMILGIYDFGFSGMRQIIAMSIFFIAFKYLVNKSFVKYSLLILLSASVHKTAIVMFIPYIIINTPLKKYYQKFYFIIAGVILIFSPYIANIVTIIFNENLLRYTQSSNGLGFGDILIIIIFIAGIILVRKSKYIRKSELFDVLQIICSFVVLFQILSIQSYMFVRLNLYLYSIVCLYVPQLYNGYKSMLSSSNDKYLAVSVDYFGTILFTVITLLFYYILLQGNPHSIIPHSFYWQSF